MGKPTVTLTLAGDEQKLTQSFDKVNSAAKNMSDGVDRASSSMSDAGSRFDSAGEAADGAEGKFMGFHDVLDGVKGAFETLSDPSASLTDKLIGLGQAGADIAGGLASFLIPALQSVWTRITATTAGTWALTAAQTAWNAITNAGAIAMRLLNAAFVSSPIGWLVLLIGGLVAAFVILWNKSEGFRNFFIGMWNGIKSVVGGVIDWIKSVWSGLPGFFQGIVDGIGRIFSGIGNAIKNAFKSAINFLIDILNGAIGAVNALIRGYNSIPFAPDIPQIPKIPRLHTGGVVPGMPGQEVLTILQAGEHVSTSSQGGGGRTVTFAGDLDSAFATAFMKLVRTGQVAID